MTTLASAPSHGGKGYVARRRRAGAFLVLPAIVVLLLVLALPIVASLLLSLQEVDTATGVLVGNWVGLDNYVRLASDPVFATALRNSVYWMVVEVAGVVLVGLAFGLLPKSPARGSALDPFGSCCWSLGRLRRSRTPFYGSGSTNASYGMLNRILLWLGVIDQPVVWLGDASTALNALLLAEIWKEIPFIAPDAGWPAERAAHLVSRGSA